MPWPLGEHLNIWKETPLPFREGAGGQGGRPVPNTLFAYSVIC